MIFPRLIKNLEQHKAFELFEFFSKQTHEPLSQETFWIALDFSAFRIGHANENVLDQPSINRICHQFCVFSSRRCCCAQCGKNSRHTIVDAIGIPCLRFHQQDSSKFSGICRRKCLWSPVQFEATPCPTTKLSQRCFGKSLDIDIHEFNGKVDRILQLSFTICLSNSLLQSSRCFDWLAHGAHLFRIKR